MTKKNIATKTETNEGVTVTRSYADVAKIERANCEALLVELREALKGKNLDAYIQKRAALENSVVTLNGCLAREQYAEFAKTDSPLIEAIKRLEIDTVRLSDDRDKNTREIKNVSLENGKTKLNIDDFLEFMDYDTGWLHDVLRLLNLLQLREVNTFSMSHDALAKESLFFTSKYLEKMNGGTPDSKTQIIKLLQRIFDAVLATSAVEMSYKVTNHDLAFITEAATKYNQRGKCEIQMIKPRTFKSVMIDVLHHVVTGEAYKVRVNKESRN